MALPLILAGIQVAGGIAGGIQANQQKQKQKGVIGQAYRLGRERLNVRQGDQRRGQAEGLVARGLAGGGVRASNRAVSPVTPGRVISVAPGTSPADALRGRGPGVTRSAGTPRVSVTGARTLGQQQQLDLTREQQFEQDALLEQRNAANAGLSADATNALVGNIGGAIGGAIQGYQAGQQYNAYKGIDPVSPLERGAWSQPAVDALNVFNQSG